MSNASSESRPTHGADTTLAPDAGYSLAPMPEVITQVAVRPNHPDAHAASEPFVEAPRTADRNERQLSLLHLMGLVALVAIVGSLWRWAPRSTLAFVLGIVVVVGIPLLERWAEQKFAWWLTWYVLLVCYVVVSALVAFGIP